MLTLSNETLLAFLFSSLMISLSPGPSNLYIMACTLGSGKSGGRAAALGMAVGSAIYAIGTAYGLATLIGAFPGLFLLIESFGAAYLVYLGLVALRYARAAHLRKPVTLSGIHIAKRSLIVELSNPKTALFFIAFLPQFTDATDKQLINDLLLLGVLYSAMAFCCDVFVVQISHQLGRWMTKRPSIAVRQEQFVGLIFLLLGASLIWDLLR